MQTERLNAALSEHGVDDEEALKLAKTVDEMADKGPAWDKQAEEAKERLSDEYGVEYGRVRRTALFGLDGVTTTARDPNRDVAAEDEGPELTNVMEHGETVTAALGTPSADDFEEDDFVFLAALHDLMQQEEYEKSEMVVRSSR